MSKNQNSVKEQLEKLNKLVEWFEKQDEVDVEKGIEKAKEAAELIKELKLKLAKVENEFTEIKNDLENNI